MAITRHVLDYNQLYSLQLDYDAASQQLEVTVTDDGAPWPRLKKAFAHQLQVASGTEASCRHSRQGNTVTFEHVTRDFTLRLGREPIGRYTIGAGNSLSATFQRLLTVDETRRMGTFHHAEPYPIHPEGRSIEQSEALLNTHARTIITADFHTHSSGQISPRGQIEVAMQHKPYYYPVSLLGDAGIDTSYQHIPARSRKSVTRIKFPPLEKPGMPDEVEGADLHVLSEDDLAKLAAHMTMPTDRQSTFTEMEYEGYRFRYPFSKDITLTRDSLKKVAQEYAAQGIDFALISYVGLDDPKILKVVLETMEEIHNDPATRNVDIRFLNGIPRGLSLDQIEEKLEKTKILMDLPYVLGPDMLGLEVTKTNKFAALLEAFTAWADKHKPGSYTRAHAGENDKHRDNVKDFLKVAKKYRNLRYLVGHGVYGIDDETRKLARFMRKRMTFEFNPSSNIALNNIDDPSHIPFNFALENDIPFTVNSDSAGMYQTSAVQLGLAAYYAGLSAKGFQKLGEHQKNLRMEMLAYCEQVASSIPGWDSPEGRQQFYESLYTRLNAVPKAVTPPPPTVDEDAIEAKLRADQVKLIRPGESVPEFKGKFPFIFVGASGDSWKRIPRGQQRENAIAVDMLIHVMNAETSYAADGRYKNTGLCKVVHQALKDSNEDRKAQGKPLLHAVGIRVDQGFDEDDNQSYRHLTHMQRVDGAQINVADAIVDYAARHNGTLVAVGGSAFTRDIILKADQGKNGKDGMRAPDPDNHKMMLLLSNTVGASAEKAAMLHPDYKVVDGKQLIKKLYDQRPELFDKSFSPRRLNRLYEESSARVATYGYNMVDNNLVTEATSLLRKEVKQVKGRHP